MNYKKLLLVGLLVLLLDFIFLKLLGFGNIFLKMLNKIQGESTKTKVLGFILAYLILFQIYYFVMKKKNLLDSFLLGFSI